MRRGAFRLRKDDETLCLVGFTVWLVFFFFMLLSRLEVKTGEIQTDPCQSHVLWSNTSCQYLSMLMVEF